MLGQKREDNTPAIPADSAGVKEDSGKEPSQGRHLAWLPVVILLTVIGSLWLATLKG